jgi:hypothetical protein
MVFAISPFFEKNAEVAHTSIYVCILQQTAELRIIINS